MYVYVLNSSMNTLQKIFVMVGVGSLVILPISVMGNPVLSFGSLSSMFGGLRTFGGELTLITNWIGIICIFNIVVSSVGFFLFKDK